MKKIFLITLLILFLFPVISVRAKDQDWCGGLTEEERSGGLVPCGRPCDDPSTPGINESDPCTLCHLFVMIKNIIDFFLFKIVPPLAILMIAIGGFMYIVAHMSSPEILTGGQKGGPALLSQAKRLFTSVVFGLLIIYGAWLIINTFFMLIGVSEWTGLKEGWWQINCQ